MKEITKMSRLTGELEKAFRLLNEELFNNELPTPIITVTPTPKAYGHYSLSKIWRSQKNRKHEINISSDSLNRPLEETIGTLVHEMVHMYNNAVLGVADTSNHGHYHNKKFKIQAEAHGLIVSKTRYGFSYTEPSDVIFDFLLNHPEIREIEMCRATLIRNSNGETGKSKGHHRKYMCPCCGISVRATRAVNIICGDCMAQMREVKRI